MNTKFAYPLTDSTFKLIFGQNKHKQLTIDFLNDFLERKGTKIIEDISFMHQEQNPRDFGAKKSILDINCKDQAGNHFIIEIQREREYFFDMRALYYASSLLSRQLKETDPYNQLKPVIIIGILDFILYKPSDQVITHHMICDMSTGKQSIDLIELHFIELSKFNKKVDELISHIDKWIFFLKNAQNLLEIPKNYQDTPSIQEAFHLVDRLNWTPQQNRQYENEVRAMQRDITQDLAEAKELEDAIEQGALKKAESVALHGLQKGLDLSLIQELTGLSVEQIAVLRKKIS